MSPEFWYSALTRKCSWSIEYHIFSTNFLLLKWEHAHCAFYYRRMLEMLKNCNFLRLWSLKKPIFSQISWFLLLNHESSRPWLAFQSLKRFNIPNSNPNEIQIPDANLVHCAIRVIIIIIIVQYVLECLLQVDLHLLIHRKRFCKQWLECFPFIGKRVLGYLVSVKAQRNKDTVGLLLLGF